MFVNKWMRARTVYAYTEEGKDFLLISFPKKLLEKKLPKNSVCSITFVDDTTFTLKFSRKFP